MLFLTEERASDTQEPSHKVMFFLLPPIKKCLSLLRCRFLSSFILFYLTYPNPPLISENHIFHVVPKDKVVLYFPAHKTHRGFFVGNFRKNNDECILILVNYWKKAGLLHIKISNHTTISWFGSKFHYLTIKMYNSCTGIYTFGNSIYPRRIRRRSNLGRIFRGKSASYGPGNTVHIAIIQLQMAKLLSLIIKPPSWRYSKCFDKEKTRKLRSPQRYWSKFFPIKESGSSVCIVTMVQDGWSRSNTKKTVLRSILLLLIL
jgi:hypothetical protein